MAEVTADGDIIVGRPRPKNNPLIHRSEVGKPSFHNDMPPLPADYTFGAPLKRDPEGAGDVMLTWQSHSPPPSKRSYDFGRDFVTLNKKCVESQCINAKDVAEFRKTHDARILPKVTGKKPAIVPDHVISDKNHCYGSTKNTRSESVADLIQNRFELEWVEQAKARQERIDREREEERKRRASPARQLQTHKRKPTASPEQQAPRPQDFFTLKQFRDVPSRYATPTPAPQ